MLQKDNRQKILNIFFEDPLAKDFQLREISRKSGIAPPSVKRYLNELEKEGLVIKVKHRIYEYPVYSAKRDNEYFKLLKRFDNIIKIKEIGLLEYLQDNCMPDVIILFGSGAKGEDVLQSDIDIFLLCKESKLDLSKYEKKLKRKINLFFSESFSSLSKELKNNLLNGDILNGYLKVF